MKTYLWEITAYDPDAAAETVLRFSDKGFTTDSAETPPDTFYEPRIVNPGNYQRDISGFGSVGGHSDDQLGEVVLTNADGGLDHLRNYGFDGRSAVCRLGSPGGAYPTDFPVILTGTILAPQFSWSRLTLRFNDPREMLYNTPLQQTVYAGNNALPSGAEGVADLKNKVKPLLYGPALNISAPCVNTSKQIYQANDGAVFDISAVYVRGVLLTKGADYANLAALEAATVAAGTYATCLALGLFRLGSTPDGTVTCDATQGATVDLRTTAQIAKLVALRGGVVAGRIVAADIATLDLANSAVIGVWFNDKISVGEALDLICSGVGAWWGFDRLGQFRIRRLEAPTGTSVHTALLVESSNPETAPGGGSTNKLPIKEAVVNWGRNYTVQTDCPTTVSADRKGFLAQEYQSISAPDGTVLTKHLLAERKVWDTCLQSQADAQAEATRRQNLFGVAREILALREYVDPDSITLLDLGAEITVQGDRFDYDAGKQFLIIGLQPDLALNRVDLTLWG